MLDYWLVLWVVMLVFCVYLLWWACCGASNIVAIFLQFMYFGQCLFYTSAGKISPPPKKIL